MRNYLQGFFKDFGYEDSDANFLLSVYDKVYSNDQTASLLDGALNLYNQSKDADFSKIRENASAVAKNLGLYEYTLEFLVYACMTKRAKEYYKENGISQDIFYNTLLDLKYKLDECKLVKGIVGTFVAYWFDRFFKLERFALGRLQFELKDFGKDYSKNGKTLSADSKVINLHVPRSGMPITPEVCLDAFKMAKDFYKAELGDNPAFVCHSWLLFPETLSLASEKSNTYKFAKNFDVFEVGCNRNQEDLWRLFDTDEKNPDKLPTDTSLRRAFVSHLKNGGRTGWGYGVFFYNDLFNN
jgi:hypothetical protein